MRTSHYETRTKSELSERQRDVLDLIAKGRSNPQIAEALGITLDGAKFHVSEILAKLDVSSREEAAAWWRRENRLPARMSRGLRALWAAPPGRIALAGSGVAVAAVAASVVAFVMVGGGGDNTAAPPADGFVFEVPGDSGPQRVITYDAANQQIIHSFAMQQSSGELLARGGYLFAGLQQRELKLLNDDGSVARVLYTAPAGEQIFDVAVSPDRRTLALQQSTDRGVGAAIVLLNVASGRVLQTFILSVLAPGAPSNSLVQTVYWHDDSQGLTMLMPLANLPAHEGPTPEPAQATLLSLDGTVQRVRSDAMATISPDGSMVIEGVPTDPGCVSFYSAHALKIVDLATGKQLASAQDASKGLTIDAWEPNGFAAIYSSAKRGECDNAGSDYRSWSLSPDGGEPQPIEGDPFAQLADPIASRVTFSCFGYKPQSLAGEGVSGPLLGQGNSCELTGGPFRAPGSPTPTPAPVGTGRLYVDGHLVEADTESFVFLGVVSIP